MQMVRNNNYNVIFFKLIVVMIFLLLSLSTSATAQIAPVIQPQLNACQKFEKRLSSELESVKNNCKLDGDDDSKMASCLVKNKYSKISKLIHSMKNIDDDVKLKFLQKSCKEDSCRDEFAKVHEAYVQNEVKNQLDGIRENLNEEKLNTPGDTFFGLTGFQPPKKDKADEDPNEKSRPKVKDGDKLALDLIKWHNEMPDDIKDLNNKPLYSKDEESINKRNCCSKDSTEKWCSYKEEKIFKSAFQLKEEVGNRSAEDFARTDLPNFENIDKNKNEKNPPSTMQGGSYKQQGPK